MWSKRQPTITPKKATIAVIIPQEQVPSPQSLQGSQSQEMPAQEVPEEPEVSENTTDTEHNPEQSESEQSSSEEETSNVHVPITPSRTPKRPKTPKSKSSRKSVLSSSVMSFEDFRECFDKYENALPDDKKRCREEITLGYARCVWKLEDTIQFPLSSSSKRPRTR
ncbi:hypothetical protein PENFLA_c052G06124 [Penicillium flavigenum]|uniref:Uncharacterized protein n=1 Tax=Penicillium flavigenum TaxID=254877 RepID=A0A1V6SGV7_9EURO|nr:hypothetical protein PENFLA_c052G06124 [Penicillium flavigenum]